MYNDGEITAAEYAQEIHRREQAEKAEELAKKSEEEENSTKAKTEEEETENLINISNIE